MNDQVEHSLQRITAAIRDVVELQREVYEQSKETDRRLQETDRQLQETDRLLNEQSKEADKRAKQADRELRELRKQIGGLGEKFGSFTEGMAFPSMRRILERRFHMDVIGTRMIGRNNGHVMELDVLAYSNRDLDEVYIVEVKSHLREDGLQRMFEVLHDFHRFFPGHQGKKVYGILAYVDAPGELIRRVLDAGIYVARIHDGHFELQTPAGFQPRAF